MTHDAAIALYSSVDWHSYHRVGILTKVQVEMLQSAEAKPLDSSLGDHATAKNYVRSLLEVVGKVSDVAAQQYALTRIEDILLAEDCGDVGTRVGYFQGEGGDLETAAFMRSLNHTGDAYCARLSASVLATLLTHREDVDCDAFVSWLCEQLANSQSAQSDVKAAVPALTILLRATRARSVFAAHGGIGYVTKLLKRKEGKDGGKNATTAQLLYELTFCLWTLSLSEFIDNAFLTQGTVEVLCEQVTAAPREKVVRVSLATLRNICEQSTSSTVAVESAAAAMIKAGLVKTLETLKERPWSDPDIANDVDALSKVLASNYRELSTFERYVAEVDAGDLQWGLVHSEKFWRENARAAERKDFELVKKLVNLLKSQEPRIASIACYDLGEFVRFYPNGKAVLKHLGAKDLIMSLIDHPDEDLQRCALQCISKVLVTNWEFVK